MSKKVLQVDGIINELEGGASLFFSKSTNPLPPSKMQPDVIQSLEPALLPIPIQDKPTINAPPVNDLPDHKTIELSNEPTNDITKEETKEIKFERKNELSNQKYNVRTKIHHTFDIFSDQLLALRELTIEQERAFGERVLIGDLVQQALDMFISKQRNK